MSVALDARHRYISRVLSQHFGMSAMAVEEVLADDYNMQTISEFFQPEGVPSKLIFFKQSRDVQTDDGELIEAAGSQQPCLCLVTLRRPLLLLLLLWLRAWLRLWPRPRLWPL